MSSPPRTRWARWVYAAKPASWPKLLVPTLFGQALGVAALGAVSWTALALGLAFTVADLLFVVFWNDVFDRRVDAIKREMFPDGCSPKTIPDAILGARALTFAGVLAGIGVLGTAWLAQITLGREHAVLAGVGCLAIFLAYSGPPLRLNYRGGGEWLEMLGVGLALPLFQAYLQAGEIPAGAWALLPGFALLSLASATASGLADERSDRAGGKTTFTTECGNAAARRRVEGLTLAGALAWAIGVRVSVLPMALGVAWIGVAIVLVNWRRMRRCSEDAGTDHFKAQGRYKQLLHHAVWRGAMAMVVAMVVAVALRNCSAAADYAGVSQAASVHAGSRIP